MKRVLWWLLAIFAIAIAGYALSYLVLRERMFPPPLKESFLARPWGIYTHVLTGAIALALGPFQFHRGILARRRPLHRVLGRVYVISATIAGLAGLYMAAYAYGGAVTKLGFGGLAVGLLLTTSKAFLEIRRGRIATHRQWIVRSYALMFAAVTLRIELPILIAVFAGFTPAYQVVAWLCWVPNALFAEAYLRATRVSARPLVEQLAAQA
jgi:uncharacterized membrane protein